MLALKKIRGENLSFFSADRSILLLIMEKTGSIENKLPGRE